MLSKNELLYTLALQRVPNLGDTSAKKLLRLIGSAEQIFKERKSSLLKIDGIGNFKLKELDLAQQLPKAEAELRFMEGSKISYSYFLDPNYPEKLKHCQDGPIILFQKGNFDLNNRKVISIVGTRKVTEYGNAFCEKLVKDLAPFNPIIVSGFAYGVDITAQKAAVNCRIQTVGCLAHGFNRMYPSSHKKYVAKIEQCGGFLTEFWSDDLFHKTNFLRRNRIIAGVSEATVVIESAKKGGSLVTADIANSYHRDVFAVPGRTTDRQSQGCLDLIKYNKAQLMTDAEDLIDALGWKVEDEVAKASQKNLSLDLVGDEKKLYDYLKKGGRQQLDTIALDCSLPTFTALSGLFQLEMKGVIQPLPGKWFTIV